MTTQAPPTKLFDLWKPTLVSGALAVMLMALPFSSIVTLATVVGICLVVQGVLEIIWSYEIRLSEKEFIRIKAGTTDRS
jgi:uncharacterized membrane protein HdeD (DUF308 family)